MRIFSLPLAVALALSTIALTHAAPMPSPAARQPSQPDAMQARAPMYTPQPRALAGGASPNAIYDFYQPVARWAADQLAKGEELNPRDDQLPRDVLVQRQAARDAPTPTKRSDVPSVPLSELGPPSFPAEYPSCYNCQQKYSSISSCMEASSVFANATSIFNSPWSYIAVIKCACTDTFQAVYPQCVQCFQMTNQCYYLGTDPEGTGAPALVTNIRQICAFGSSLLGGSEKANYPDYNNSFTPSEVPYYTDVTQTGAGYLDQSAGRISGASAMTSVHAMLPLLVTTALACMLALLIG